MSGRIVNDRWVCHQCGRSFTLHLTDSVLSPTCPNCNSEFVEQLESRMNNPNDNEQGLPSHNYNYGLNEEGDDDDDESSSRVEQVENEPSFEFRTFPGGFIIGTSRRNQVQGQAQGQAQAQSQSNQILSSLSLSLPPILSTTSFTDMIRFVVNPGSFNANHPIWNQLGFHGDPRDYVFSEPAFQNALSALMNQNGHRLIGLSEEQISELPRRQLSEGEDMGTVTTCAICQDTYKPLDEILNLTCNHQFHSACVIPWLRKVASCPICRHDPLSPSSNSEL